MGNVGWASRWLAGGTARHHHRLGPVPQPSLSHGIHTRNYAAFVRRPAVSPDLAAVLDVSFASGPEIGKASRALRLCPAWACFSPSSSPVCYATLCYTPSAATKHSRDRKKTDTAPFFSHSSHTRLHLPPIGILAHYTPSKDPGLS